MPATQTIQSPTQPSEREWDEMRKELQDLKRRLAEQDAERNAQKQNESTKQKTPVIP
jgi:Skp family chaperone for outer membrane proteins